jgi:hypothetical protein
MLGTWSRGLDTVAVGFWVAGRYSGPTHCEGGVSKPLVMIASGSGSGSNRVLVRKSC